MFTCVHTDGKYLNSVRLCPLSFKNRSIGKDIWIAVSDDDGGRRSLVGATTLGVHDLVHDLDAVGRVRDASHVNEFEHDRLDVFHWEVRIQVEAGLDIRWIYDDADVGAFSRDLQFLHDVENELCRHGPVEEADATGRVQDEHDVTDAGSFSL